MLYDVTSVYFEGEHNELAAYGEGRDGKRGKKQIVVGLLTAPDGEPLAIKVFRGNTADPSTVADQIETLRSRFNIRDVLFVGDRGMVKQTGKEQLTAQGYRYLTALTTPQIRTQLRAGTIQLELFDEDVQEVEVEGRRLILRRNGATAARAERRRTEKLAALRREIAERNTFVAGSKRADPAAGLRRLEQWARDHRLMSFVSLELEGRELVLRVDDEALAEAAGLDGCYVLETNVSRDLFDAESVNERYMDLQRVERDFRTLKTSMLQIRPVYLRKEVRARAHVFVAMLGLKIVRELRRCLTASFGTTDTNPEAETVASAPPALGRMTQLEFEAGEGLPAVTRLPRPDERQSAILESLGIALPRPKPAQNRKKRRRKRRDVGSQ